MLYLLCSEPIPKFSAGDPWNFGSDLDPHLRLMDPAPDPTPDPTPFYSDFKVHIFFYKLPAGTLSSVLKINKFCAIMLCKNFILQALFQSAQHL